MIPKEPLNLFPYQEKAVKEILNTTGALVLWYKTRMGMALMEGKLKL